METAVYSRNRTMSKAIATSSPDHEVTLYILWHGQMPDIKHLHVSGYTTYVMVPIERNQKFDNNAISCMYFRYMRTTKHYCCLEPRTGRVYYKSEVVYNKSSLYYEMLQSTSPSGPNNKKNSESESEHELIAEAPRQPSATAARITQKIRPRNLESNLGLTWELP